MKILQLGKFWPIIGGVEKVMFNLTLGMSQREVRCDMMCAAFEGDTKTITLNSHGKVFVVKTLHKANSTMISPQMISSLRKCAHEYDIIHIHHPDPMAALALKMSGYKGKVILHWHSDILRQKVMLKFYKPLQAWLLKRADVVICTSPNYAEGSAALKSVKDKLQVVPIGCERIYPDKAMVEAIRRKTSGRKIIFSLGRLVSYKGFDNLIQAAASLPAHYLVVIAGAGPLETQLKKQIAANGLENKVWMPGYVSDEERNAWMGAADAFCLPSVYKTEAYGVVLIESMSIGLPVIATEIPGSGTSWVNAHEDSGLNAPCFDPDRLADAIIRVCDEKDVHNGYIKRAGKRWEAHFTIGKMLDKVEDIYKSVLC